MPKQPTALRAAHLTTERRLAERFDDDQDHPLRADHPSNGRHGRIVRPLTVAVLGGGRSSEHDVSLASAASIRCGLAQGGHAPVAIEVGRDGVWRRGESEVAVVPGRGLEGVDVVFPALHGPFGEDGTVQGLLECLDVPYVGDGVLASSLCMDKVMFRDLMRHSGVPQVEYRTARAEELAADRDAVLASVAELGLPVFVKPARLGSSIGVSRVGAENELVAALEAAFEHDALAVVEAAASGLEVECSVIGNDQPLASVPGEILAAGERGWYDYEAKYTPGGMQLIVPARVPDHVLERIRELATTTYRLVGCSGLARVDFFVEGKRVLVNEVNTMPAFTDTSVFARLVQASGLTSPELLDRLLELAIERHAEEHRYLF
jgi:D-alanine-D-alanine ligase